MPVKAIVRTLSDDELIIAQGVENSAREDLSFIERAVFALMLESAGRSRVVIQQALAIDRAEASKLVSVAKSVPNDLVRAIGKAPKIGRRRWQEFAEVLNDKAAVTRAKTAAALPVFANLDSDARFARVFSAANSREVMKVGVSLPLAVKDAAGRILAQVRSSDRDVRVTLTKSSGSAFAEFLTARLPDLFHEFNSFDAERVESKES